MYLLPVVAGDRNGDSAGDYWSGGLAVVSGTTGFAEDCLKTEYGGENLNDVA